CSVGWVTTTIVTSRVGCPPTPQPPFGGRKTVLMTTEMPADLLEHALAAKGFMPEDEGAFLHRVARERLPYGPALEIGTYCGKSAIYLGAAAREVGGQV